MNDLDPRKIHSADGRQNPFDPPADGRFELDATRETRPFTQIPLVRFVAIVLLALLLLYLLYAVFVHPIRKLTLRLFLSGNCEMTLRFEMEEGSYYYSDAAMIRVDGNVIEVGAAFPMTQDTDYYKLEDGVLYRYALGGFTEVSDGSFDGVGSSALFNRKNYEREGLFVWRLKDGVDVGKRYNVRFRYKNGKPTFTWSEGYLDYTLTFDSFGKTPIDPPWGE